MMNVVKFIAQIAAGVAVGNAANAGANKLVEVVQKVIEAKKKEEA